MMISKIKQLKNDSLIRGSIILFSLIIAANIFNYVFQIIMARVLGPNDYGILAVLMSIIYVLTIPSEAIQTAITKYTSIFNAKNRQGKIKDLFFRSIKKGIFFASMFFAIYLIISIFLSSFLNISIWLIIITGLFIFVVFTIPIGRGVLQGRKQFSQLGMNTAVESLLKVLLSLIFVLAGFKVYGAIGAVISSSIIALSLSLLPIRDILSSKREKEEFNSVYKANMPLLIAMVSIVLMYSVDIILARRFFPSQIAGEFAFVSLIGKVIVFASSSVGKALFPISSEQYNSGNRTRGLLKKALLIVLLMSAVSLAIYFFYPELIIRILSLGSTQYIGAANILFTLGLAYSFVSVASIIVLYRLSINRMRKSAYFLPVFVAIEVILLSMLNSSLVEFSMALLLSSLLMFLYSILLIKK